MAERPGFLRGAVILSATVAVTKILGAAYKIPLGNILGAQGMAHFYVAYNVYNVWLLILCAGLPVALSRQIARAHALGLWGQERRTFRVALFLLTVLGLGSGAALFFFPRFFALALHDEAAAPAIRALAPSLLCMGSVSALRGFSQGRGDMRPTAVSQLIESLCKLAAGLLLTFAALRVGAGEDNAAAAALCGVSLGSVCALLYLCARHRREPFPVRYDVPAPRRVIAGELLRAAVPLMLGSAGMSVITLLDQTLILSTLQKALGYSAEAAARTYGEYTFSMTLFALPPAMLMTLSMSLLPAVSAARAQHRERTASRQANSALRLCLMLCLPMGAGLSCMAGPILHLLYPAQPLAADAAAYHLAVLGLASIFVCLMALTNGILQAYGRERITVLTLLCGGALKIAANYLMVSNPAIGIRGAAAGTLYCYSFIVLLNAVAIARFTSAELRFFTYAWRPLAATATMTVFISAAYPFFLSRLSPSPAALLTVFCAAVCYVSVLLALGALRPEETKALFFRKLC